MWLGLGLGFEFNPSCPWLNIPAALVNSQLVCLQPVGILNSCRCSVLSFRCVSLALKSPYGERSIKYVLYCIDAKGITDDPGSASGSLKVVIVRE